MSYTLGIDFGTTNTVVSIYRNGRAEVIPFQGNNACPSVVGFRDEETILIGQEARMLQYYYPEQVFSGIKKFLGNRDKRFSMFGNVYTPVELMSFIFKIVVEEASKTLGEKVEDVVITEPALFTSLQTEDLLNAALMAGLNVVKIIPEPVAAALSLELSEFSTQDFPQDIMIFDFGGGKLEVSIIHVGNPTYDILSVSGDSNLGGDVFDQEIANYISQKFEAESGISLNYESSRDALIARAELLREAEQAKAQLSSFDTAQICIPNLMGSSFETELTRAEFNNLIKPYLYQTIELVNDAINHAGSRLEDINRLMLVGGSTLIPAVRNMLAEMGLRPVQGVNPATAVSDGAAIFAANLSNAEEQSSSHQIKTRTPVSVQLSADSGETVDIIPRNTFLPVTVTKEIILFAGADKIQIPLYEENKLVYNLNAQLPDRLQHDTDAQLCIEVDESNQMSARLIIAELNMEIPLHNSPSQGADSTHQGTPEMPAPLTDRVHFSVTAPSVMQPGMAYIIDVWAHLEKQRQEVERRARASIGSKDILVKTKGPIKVARGTILSVHLKLEGLTVDEPEDTISWEGEIGNANFTVTVPKNAKKGTYPGKATIYADGLLQAVKLNFVLTVGKENASRKSVPVKEKRYSTAFASYASVDWPEVMLVIEGIQKGLPDLYIYTDVKDLRSGDRYEKKLLEMITTSDIFYLFWSKAARESQWVEKEWRCAYESRGIDHIDPVPLDTPEEAPPPPELAEHLHFSDWTLAYKNLNRLTNK